jgi:hypothetical protein
MAGEADALPDRGIPFAMEKPEALQHGCGAVRRLAGWAAAEGAFAAVPFVWRQSELIAVDDYSLLTLRSGGRTFHVETGYLMRPCTRRSTCGSASRPATTT